MGWRTTAQHRCGSRRGRSAARSRRSRAAPNEMRAPPAKPSPATVQGDAGPGDPRARREPCAPSRAQPLWAERQEARASPDRPAVGAA